MKDQRALQFVYTRGFPVHYELCTGLRRVGGERDLAVFALKYWDK